MHANTHISFKVVYKVKGTVEEGQKQKAQDIWLSSETTHQCV